MNGGLEAGEHEVKMVGNEKNKDLYWYGFWAKIQKFLGQAVIVIGLIVGIFLMISPQYYYVGLGCIVLTLLLGIFLIIRGQLQYFDFEMQSGKVLYHGGKE